MVVFFCDIISGNSVIEDLFFFSIPVCPDILKSQIIRLFRQRLWRNFLKLAKVVILIWQTRKSTISLQRDIQLLRCLLRSWFWLFLFHLGLFHQDFNYITVLRFSLFFSSYLRSIVEENVSSDEQKARISKNLGWNQNIRLTKCNLN